MDHPGVRRGDVSDGDRQRVYIGGVYEKSFTAEFGCALGYQNWGIDNCGPKLGRADAFQHCYGSALNYEYGDDAFVSDMLLAHEAV